MTVYDFNGTGAWSRRAVIQRYAEYARRFSVRQLRDLTPREHSVSGKQWIYPVMERVIEGIARGDPACAEIGVEFIQENAGFPFGKILKSNTARALRRASLTADQQDRIRRRVMEMLVAGFLPHEFKEYARLGRKIGLGELWFQLERQVDLSKPWNRHYYDYFRRFAIPPATA